MTNNLLSLGEKSAGFTGRNPQHKFTNFKQPKKRHFTHSPDLFQHWNQEAKLSHISASVLQTDSRSARSHDGHAHTQLPPSLGIEWRSLHAEMRSSDLTASDSLS